MRIWCYRRRDRLIQKWQDGAEMLETKNGEESESPSVLKFAFGIKALEFSVS